VLPRPVFWRGARLVGAILFCCVVSMCFSAAVSTKYPVVLSHAAIAFALGLRHAVDCDHLAAIDNVTRQLMMRGQQPISVGFWFALGHSTVVMLLTAALAGGYSWAWHASGNTNVTEAVSLVAAVVSVLLLGGIGLLNAHVATGLFKDWLRLQRHCVQFQDQEVKNAAETSLQTALSMIPGVRQVFEHVNVPYKMYGVGFLFGLSFDSATQVGLIGLAAMSGSSGQVPPWIVLIFPLSFSCGMCLIDTANGLLMLATYSWTSVRPVQKLFYNFVVTSMSAGIALIICSLELLQILAREARLRGPFWSFVENVDMVTVGYSIIFAFLLVFTVAVCYARRCSRSTAGAKKCELPL